RCGRRVVTTPAPMRTVLIANRGEIARRIIHAAHQLGLRAACVASDADRDAVWHRSADVVVPLEGSTATETYLRADLILDAARRVGADAIHPGYGFLSERASFADACEAAGIAFVGPTADAMRRMGGKVPAVELARSVGVPTVPGVSGVGLGPDELAAAAAKIGFPILIKASAGGGGRGMRRVDAPDEFPDALAAAKAESLSAFGDDTVLLERYFPLARHVEVQVLGDGRGKVIHLFERDCSVQRRYQKIIEEAPAPSLPESQRAAITAAAVRLAEAVDYRSAGTVEFLVDPTAEPPGGFYFLEMNTRLQVEHPVSELVTGLDLAAWQLRLAGGEPLTLDQKDVTHRGHAIEARLYAEDPAAGFLPSIGRLAMYRSPSGPGVRVDDGVATGSAITPHYDAMIAKVIAAGADRAEAIARLSGALAETIVLGVTTNLDYLQAIIGHPSFRSGDVHTRFLDEHLPDGHAAHTEPDDAAWLAAAAFELLGGGGSRADAGAGGEVIGGASDDGPWAALGGWRNVR
ncbi:MAG: biotin carboxylase N-terminal domain-containing protein, partial [Ardenticatenales bacterium]